MTVNYTMKEMPCEDRPQEKLFKYGADSLTNAELLALVIRNGSRKQTALELSQTLINRAVKGRGKSESALKVLLDSTPKELMEVPGIGESKASMIIAALTLAKRINNSSDYEKVKIRTPDDMADYIMDDMRLLNKESFRIAVLNTKKEVEVVRVISEGTINATIVHPRDVFRVAIKENAHTIIVMHNHPTGDPTPSREDINITKNLIEVGKIVKIDVIDHIIIGDNRYFSFLENDLM